MVKNKEAPPFAPLFFLLTVLGLSLLSPKVSALSKEKIHSMEEIIQRNKIEDEFNDLQKFKIYSTIGKELDLYGHEKEAIKYYEKAIELGLSPKKIDLLPTYTEYLFCLYKMEEKDLKERAKKFYQEKYIPLLKEGKYPQRENFLSFWKKFFAGVSPSPFFEQYFRDRNLKELIQKGDYEKAYEITKKIDPSSLDLVQKLQVDLVGRLYRKEGEKRKKKAPLYCAKKLKKYKKSAAVSLEICRYIRDRKLMYGNLQQLLSRAKEEAPSLIYMVESLKDIR